MPRTAKPQVPGEPQVTEPDVDVALTADEQEAIEAELDDEQGYPDDDAAIAAGQKGKARKISKPRAPVAPAKLGPNADSTRSGAANINAKQQMTTNEAKAIDRTGKMQRPVLTEAGWYCPLNSAKERAARRKQGEEEFVDIE